MPAQVVVQLDAETLRVLQEFHKVRWHDKYPPLGSAIAKWGQTSQATDILKVVASGDLQEQVDEFSTAFEKALYADSRQHLWGPVLDAAVAVGAEVVVADRARDISLSRILAARKLSGDEKQTVSLGKIVSQQMGPDAKGAADAAVKRSLARHGCLKPEETKSAAYMLIAEAAIFGKVRPENLAAVRSCKALSADLDRDLELIAAAPTLRAAGGEPAPAVSAVKASREPRPWLTSPVARTIYGERELLFARALQPPSAPERDIVGIFDPDHVAGIARAWRHARSPESDALAAEYMRPVPSEVTETYIRPPAPGTIAMLSGGALAIRSAFKSARPLRTAALVVVGTVVAVPAAGIFLANRALGALLRADRYLRAVEEVKSRNKQQEARASD